MDNFNVCLVNDSFPPAIDGVANAVTNYARIISSELGRASVVTPYYPDADDSVFDFPVIRYPSLDFTKFVGYRAGIPFSPEVSEKIEKSGFDIIHTHCPITSTMLARTMRERINAPVVITYHTKFDIDIANAVKSRLLQEEAAKVLVANISACDEVWTVSRGAGENLRSLGYEGDYIVMPNGVDFPRGRVSDELVASVTGGYDLPDGVPVFLFVGRMMWYKGIRIILDAIKKIYDGGHDFRMVFVGGGGDRDEIIAYAEELGITDRVFFVPAIHDRDAIRAWYCRADMFLFPSTFDTNGLVVREAAACALGSVLIKGSCAAEDSTDMVNSIFIEENADSMAAALENMLEQPEIMGRIGENAQRDLYMSWETAVKNAYERYGIVIEGYRGGKYPEHEKFTDEMFNRTGLTLSRMAERRENRRETLEHIRSEYNELLSDMQSDREQMIKSLTEDMDRVTNSIAAERERVQDEINDVLEDLEAERSRIGGEIESLYREIETERRRVENELMEAMDRFL